VLSDGSNGIAYRFEVEAVLDWRRDIERRAVEEAAAREAEIDQLALELTGGTVASSEIAMLPLRDRAAALDTERKALLLAREKGETLWREQVARDYQALFGLLRQRALSMPMLLGRLAHLEPHQIKTIEVEMKSLLRELSLQIEDPGMRPQEISHAA
jgi:hypothetical protein